MVSNAARVLGSVRQPVETVCRRCGVVFMAARGALRCSNVCRQADDYYQRRLLLQLDRQTVSGKRRRLTIKPPKPTR